MLNVYYRPSTFHYLISASQGICTIVKTSSWKWLGYMLKTGGRIIIWTHLSSKIHAQITVVHSGLQLGGNSAYGVINIFMTIGKIVLLEWEDFSLDILDNVIFNTQPISEAAGYRYGAQLFPSKQRILYRFPYLHQIFHFPHLGSEQDRTTRLIII